MKLSLLIFLVVFSSTVFAQKECTIFVKPPILEWPSALDSSRIKRNVLRLKIERKIKKTVQKKGYALVNDEAQARFVVEKYHVETDGIRDLYIVAFIQVRDSKTSEVVDLISKSAWVSRQIWDGGPMSSVRRALRKLPSCH